MTLFDLQDGERFEWQGRKYTLVGITTSDVAVVIEEGVVETEEQYFNPYASITKLGG